jgi:hypothetical protein
MLGHARWMGQRAPADVGFTRPPAVVACTSTSRPSNANPIASNRHLGFTEVENRECSIMISMRLT